MHKVELEKPSFSLKAANFFGALGYLSLLFEWFWVFGLLLFPLVGKIRFIWPEAAQPVQHAPMFTTSTPVALAAGAVVTVLCLAVVAYALYTVPRSVAKTGSRATRVAAKAFIPAIVHHKPVSKKTARRLTFAVVCYIKAAGIILPLLTCFAIPGTGELSRRVIMVAALFLAFWAVVNFSIQLVITKLSHVNSDKIW